ncbi:hypothetical protein AU508_07325 [Lonsdalea populi]|nr:hypothetical protein AU508_07325 [Lonsdalea populi]
MQGVLAVFPCGMPGSGLDIEGAMQQAPQSGRQSITMFLWAMRYRETKADLISLIGKDYRFSTR